MRPRGDADAVRFGDRESQPDTVPNPDVVSDSVGVGQPIGNGDRQRIPDAMPIAVCDGNAITVADAQWQRETLDLALVRRPPTAIPLPASRIADPGPSYRHRRSESPS